MRILFNIFFILFSFLSFSQEKEDGKTKEKKEKTIEDLTESSTLIDGLFPIYQDTVTGELKMIIHTHQIDKDFIYFSQIAEGVTEAGSFRGL